MVFTPMIHICMLRGCDFYANPTQHLSWILSVHCCELLHSSFACCITMKLLRKELFFSFFKCNRTELKITLNVWLTFTLNSVPNVSMYLLETSHATNYGTDLGLYVFNKVRRGKKQGRSGFIKRTWLRFPDDCTRPNQLLQMSLTLISNRELLIISFWLPVRLKF